MASCKNWFSLHPDYYLHILALEENQPRRKSYNLKSNLICNIFKVSSWIMFFALFLASTPASKVEVEVVKISTPSSDEAIEDSLEDAESESNW